MNRILFALALSLGVLDVEAQPEPRGKIYAAPPGVGASPGENRVTITVESESRIIKANGLPDHLPGQFPNRGNPNSIEPQRYTFHISAHCRWRTRAERQTEYFSCRA